MNRWLRLPAGGDPLRLPPGLYAVPSTRSAADTLDLARLLLDLGVAPPQALIVGSPDLARRVTTPGVVVSTWPATAWGDAGPHVVLGGFSGPVAWLERAVKPAVVDRLLELCGAGDNPLAGLGWGADLVDRAAARVADPLDLMDLLQRVIESSRPDGPRDEEASRNAVDLAAAHLIHRAILRLPEHERRVACDALFDDDPGEASLNALFRAGLRVSVGRGLASPLVRTLSGVTIEALRIDALNVGYWTETAEAASEPRLSDAELQRRWVPPPRPPAPANPPVRPRLVAGVAYGPARVTERLWMACDRYFDSAVPTPWQDALTVLASLEKAPWLFAEARREGAEARRRLMGQAPADSEGGDLWRALDAALAAFDPDAPFDASVRAVRAAEDASARFGVGSGLAAGVVARLFQIRPDGRALAVADELSARWQDDDSDLGFDLRVARANVELHFGSVARARVASEALAGESSRPPDLLAGALSVIEGTLLSPRKCRAIIDRAASLLGEDGPLRWSAVERASVLAGRPCDGEVDRWVAVGDIGREASSRARRGLAVDVAALGKRAPLAALILSAIGVVDAETAEAWLTRPEAPHLPAISALTSWLSRTHLGPAPDLAILRRTVALAGACEFHELQGDASFWLARGLEPTDAAAAEAAYQVAARLAAEGVRAVAKVELGLVRLRRGKPQDARSARSLAQEGLREAEALGVPGVEGVRAAVRAAIRG
jgi:hypothetical protein